MENKFDFSGWATKANIKCADGRTIMPNAFEHNDGKTVPLVWNHQHDNPNEVLGHALLENRPEGVYAYCTFNDTESGQVAKQLVQHGDVDALSIYANQLKERMSCVIHGNIREVSLVLAGANPGASIQNVIKHGEEFDDEAEIYTGENIELMHAGCGSSSSSEEDDKKKKKKDNELEHSKDGSEETKKDDKSDSEKTVKDVFDTLNEDQKTVVYAMLGQVLGENGSGEENKGGDDDMKHHVFDNEQTQTEGVLSHDAMTTIITDAKRYGSLKESFLAHAGDYGIDDIDWLFPNAKNLNTPPEFIKRDTGWVPKVMNSIKHSPFSRIKSMFADITEDEARAKGYIKGKLKKEEVFSLLKRTTTPTTIYKKQKLDRDDVIDITDFDVVSWLKAEMRTMLDEEIARAILVGDGRLASSDDKINEQNIRPIWKDDDLFTIKATVNVTSTSTDEEKAKEFIRTVIKSRKNYKGSGEPTLYTTEDVLTDCLLIEDTNGRIIYDSVSKLATTLRVKEIVTVPVMENLSRQNSSSETLNVMGIIVNLSDYDVGADKGGARSMFEDFDIDYNQQKYLIETRCSGALIKPYSAIALESKVN